MENTVNERIEKLIVLLAKGKQIDFSESTGIPQPTLSAIVGKRKSEPGYAILIKILEKYPDVNSDWLMKGEGEPFRNMKVLPSKPQDGGKFGEQVVEDMRKEINWLRDNLDRALRIIENAGLGKLEGVAAEDAALVEFFIEEAILNNKQDLALKEVA